MKDDQPILTSFPELEASPSQPNGPDSKQSPSAKPTNTASPSSSKTSTQFWPDNKRGRPGRSYLSMNLRELAVYGQRDFEGQPTGKQPQLWPTPTGCVAQDGEEPETWLKRREKLKETANNGNGAGMPLTIAAKLWPTPNAMDAMKARSQEALERAKQIGGCSNLKDMIAHPSSYQTSETSMAETSPESISLQGDFLASLSALPGSSEARKMTVTSGRKCSALSRKRDPLGCLEKTLLESWQWNSTRCYLTWRPSATPQGRLLFQLAPWMRPTDETESGLWPTVTGDDANNATRASGSYQSLTREVRNLWATPNVLDSLPPNPDLERHGQREGRTDFSNLREQVMWPTPNAGDDRGPNPSIQKAIQRHAEKGVNKQVGLRDAVMWPTATSRDHKDTGDCLNVEDNSLLGRVVGPTKENGSLNPAWVEWLMGYPTGWLD